MTYQDYFRIAHGKSKSYFICFLSAILMTISWGIFIVTGVLFARHFRGHETIYCGVKMWFSVRLLLFSIEKWLLDAQSTQFYWSYWCCFGHYFYHHCPTSLGWSIDTVWGILLLYIFHKLHVIQGMSAGKWHSLLGSLSIFLAIIQPINALFR